MTSDDLTAWIGRTERVEDDISPAQAAAAAATLEPPPPLPTKGAALPPLWHWFYFLPRAPQSQLGIDGHPRRGGFIPPIPYPRRMFAGARIRFHQRSSSVNLPGVRGLFVTSPTNRGAAVHSHS